MNGNNLRIRRQDRNTRGQHVRSRDTLDPPGLMNSFSGSSFSSNTSGSPNRDNIFRRQSRNSPKRSPRRSQHGITSSDKRIIRGAEMLRRELLQNEEKQSDYVTMNSSFPSEAVVHGAGGKNRSSRHQEISREGFDCCDEDAANCAYISGDESDDVLRDDDDEDTLLLLQRASRPQREPKFRSLGPSSPPRYRSHMSRRTSYEDHISTSSHYSNPIELLQDLKSDEEALQKLDEATYLSDAIRQDSYVTSMISPSKDSFVGKNIVPPRTPEYNRLMRDPAYLHAQRAGTLWQSLVSQHVRFPSSWWNGARSPPMGVAQRQMWQYAGRHRVRGNKFSRKLVHNRASAGRLLLHIIVQDIVTMTPVQDIAIGCFHPNARGVRLTTAPNSTLEGCRDIWLALRRRGEDVPVVESLLKGGVDDDANASPLGGKHAVDNSNMRAVFGDKPPMYTVFVGESELYELFSTYVDRKMSPAALLVHRYMPGW